MRTNPTLIAIALCSALLLSGHQASGAVAYDIPTSGGPVTGNESAYPNIGFDFTVGSTPISVTSLGAFDSAQDGLTANIIVTIYQNSGGTFEPVPFAFTVFEAGESYSLGPNSAYRFYTLGNPVSLTTGDYRIVAAGYNSTEPAYFDSQTTPLIQTSTGGGLISFGNNYYAESGFPNTQAPGPYGAATFEFSAVPEPTGFALAGFGILVLIYKLRGFVIQRKQAA